MAAKTGAGAATSSGIGYQNRVAAYFLATALCDTRLQILDEKLIQTIGLETAAAVDDIVIRCSDHSALYFQVKRKISFSTTHGSELHSAFTQFVEQRRRSPNEDSEFFLITTGESSRKITTDMKAALDSFRLGPEKDFRRDQPSATITLLDDLWNLVSSLCDGDNEAQKRNTAAEILRHIHVVKLELEKDSPLEQATILLLGSRKFVSPSLFWGKLIADCVNHSSLRHSISIDKAKAEYARFVSLDDQDSLPPPEEFFKIEFGDFDFPVGRELVLGTLESPKDDDGSKNKVFLFEFYRFDDDCNERIRFESGKCFLKNGMVINVIQRAATTTGILRFLEGRPDVTADKELCIIPINSKEDFERGLCADRQRENLKSAFQANSSPLECLRCGKPVSSRDANVVEIGTGTTLQVGIIHSSCTEPLDRIIGTIKSEFFERYGFLRNFDANAWFAAIQDGQGVFSSSAHLQTQSFIGWSGGNYPVDVPSPIM